MRFGRQHPDLVHTAERTGDLQHRCVRPGVRELNGCVAPVRHDQRGTFEQVGSISWTSRPHRHAKYRYEALPK